MSDAALASALLGDGAPPLQEFYSAQYGTADVDVGNTASTLDMILDDEEEEQDDDTTFVCSEAADPILHFLLQNPNPGIPPTSAALKFEVDSLIKTALSSALTMASEKLSPRAAPAAPSSVAPVVQEPKVEDLVRSWRPFSPPTVRAVASLDAAQEIEDKSSKEEYTRRIPRPPANEKPVCQPRPRFRNTIASGTSPPPPSAAGDDLVSIDDTSALDDREGRLKALRSMSPPSSHVVLPQHSMIPTLPPLDQHQRVTAADGTFSRGVAGGPLRPVPWDFDVARKQLFDKAARACDLNFRVWDGVALADEPTPRGRRRRRIDGNVFGTAAGKSTGAFHAVGLHRSPRAARSSAVPSQKAGKVLRR